MVGVWSNLVVQVQERLAESCGEACQIASEETGLPLETFPESCPWTTEQILDYRFWPEM